MGADMSAGVLGSGNECGLDDIRVNAHDAEPILRGILIVIGIFIWIASILTIVGLFYGVLIGLFVFLTHLGLIAHLRGSAVKLGDKQFPGIHTRVVALAKRIGLKKTPDVYLLQSGGVLNAFATRFGAANFVVLHSDLVKACGDNQDALDFIIAHELGHIHRGHLRKRWLYAPALLIPFLGSAYSRVCEYTCDRYGYKAVADRKQGMDGLGILAAGPQYAALVDKAEFMAQGRDLNTVFMKLGGWFSTHPPLALRMAALDPIAAPSVDRAPMATIGALMIVVLLSLLPVVGAGFLFKQMAEDIRKQQFSGQAAPKAFVPNGSDLHLSDPNYRYNFNGQGSNNYNGGRK